MRSTPYRQIVTGFLLLAAAGSGSALTLGRAQGLAVLGRPLDLSIPVGLDSASDVADLCAEAEVLYGDTRVEPRRIDLRSVPAGEQANLRMRVSLPVDEAFVTVSLRVGCTQPLTRRYVLLSEQPADAADAAAVVPQAPPQVQTPVATAAAAAAAPARSGGAIDPNVRSAVPTMASELPAPPARRPQASAPKAQQQPRAAVPAGDRPRLKLDSVDLRPGTRPGAPAPAAKAAPVAPAAPAPAPSASAPAPAAAASQAAAAASEPVAGSERIQSLEADLRALRESVIRSNNSVNELRARLEQAERERYSNSLVYVLAGLLAAASALAGLFWWRGRQAEVSTRDWWLDAPATDVKVPVPGPVTPTAPQAVSVPPAGESSAAAAALAPAVADEASTSLPPLVADGVRASEPLPLSSDELSDIQQEADFFMSLGEYDRAIEVLRNHIEAHPQASAVAWLDLLEIHHKLGRREEYEQLRRDFEWLFNARLPAFDRFDQGQHGLEEHPELLSRIQQQWPQREVLVTIDSAIFRRPAQQGGEPLDLQTYRDLLFLHHVASELCSHESSEFTRSFGGLGVRETVLASAPVSLAGDGLDINLDHLQDVAPILPSETTPAASGLAGNGMTGLGSSAQASPTSDIQEDEHRLLDFHVDEGERYKLPRQDDASKA